MPEGVDCGSFDDPLTDPLAIDDEFNVTNDTIETVSDTESSTIDEVIFVDIEKLVCKSKDDVVESKEHESDINGNDRQLTVEIKKKIVDKVQANRSKSNEVKEDQTNVEEGKEVEEANKSAESSFVISVNSSEPELEDVTDTSVLLEEIRSDGSDSGLGSDNLRSMIERTWPR